MNPAYESPGTFNEHSIIYSEDASNLTSSQPFRIADVETGISDDEGSTDDSADEKDRSVKKREKHRHIEAQRRKKESEYIQELSSLVPNWCETKPSKLPQLTLLKMAADLLNQMNSRNQQNPLLPSYLTQEEVNFLNFEASNAFLFVTTIESRGFHIIHVTDSIQRVLHVPSEYWFGHNLFDFIHPDDLSQVQSYLSPITQYIDTKPSFKCRLQPGNGSYSSVMIDGTIKKVDQTLKPISNNEHGEFVFLGICHLPLTSKYSKENLRLHRNPQISIFSCRCSPHTWQIFLVDCSISTLPSISVNFFRGKSILEFISPDQREYVREHLLNSTLTSKDELITCYFVYSPTEILPMILEIKPLFNPSTKQTDCIELTFKYIPDLIKTPD